MTVFFYNRKTKKYAHNTADSVESALKFGLTTPQRKRNIKITKIAEDEYRTNTIYDLHIGEIGYQNRSPKSYIIFRGQKFLFPSL